MEVLQMSLQYPKYVEDDKSIETLKEYLRQKLARGFYEALDEHLAKAPGGIIMSAPRIEWETIKDWLFDGPDAVRVRMYANVENLPEPPEYRLIGGPMDGRIVRTNGERIWLVPYYEGPPSIASYTDIVEDKRRIAEYERQGETSAYMYKRTINA